MKAGKKVELLAPAGNMEGFYGAIHAGADAVYLGGNRFGARAYADNFTLEELTFCIRYAHIWGRKVYLTVNTLVKEQEFKELYEYLAPLYEAGLDAVIVQDIGVFHYIKSQFPGLLLHVSTQMTITGVYGAELLKTMGASRIVPARELSLEEIAKIKQETNLEIECFIHGAMCYCYSGQCLFCSILGGRSGNRGRCAQPCRLPYSVENGNNRTKECYPLSLKDMCTIEHLPELIASGIDSFKIEGRMKKPEYTAGVTAIYRRYIDSYYKESAADDTIKACKPDRQDMQALSSLYIRSERQDGYYHKHNGRDMITLHTPAYSRSDEVLLTSIRKQYLEKRPLIPVDMEANFVCGQPARLAISLAGKEEKHFVKTVMGDLVEPAQRQPVTKENLEKQLRKLGGSCFTINSLSIVSDENIFLPLKAINELRREAVTALENALIEKQGAIIERTASKITCSTGAIASETEGGHLFLSLKTMEQLKGSFTWLKSNSFKGIDRIYINGDLLLRAAKEQTVTLCSQLSNHCEIVIALPYVLRAFDLSYLEQIFSLAIENPCIFSGFLVRSMEGMGYLRNNHYQGKIYTDAGFYNWNRESIAFWKPYMTGFCLPLELNEREQRELLGVGIPCEKIIYGRIPMMITANCVAKTTTGCLKAEVQPEAMKDNILYLADRYKKRFPVCLNCTHCMNIIYNSVPLSLHSQLERWQKKVDIRLDFTIEGTQEMLDIITFFIKTKNRTEKGKLPALPYQEYTTGHEKRGVE